MASQEIDVPGEGLRTLEGLPCHVCTESHDASVCMALSPRPHNPNPKTHAPNPRPQTANPTPHPHPTSQTPNPRPQTPNPKPHTPHSTPHTSHPTPQTPKPKTGDGESERARLIRTGMITPFANKVNMSTIYYQKRYLPSKSSRSAVTMIGRPACRGLGFRIDVLRGSRLMLGDEYLVESGEGFADAQTVEDLATWPS